MVNKLKYFTPQDSISCGWRIRFSKKWGAEKCGNRVRKQGAEMSYFASKCKVGRLVFTGFSGNLCGLKILWPLRLCGFKSRPGYGKPRVIGAFVVKAPFEALFFSY